ncbi:25926_t:CDS:1, partial [Dentiscutata erythropus]
GIRIDHKHAMNWKNEKESRKISFGPSVNIYNSTFSRNSKNIVTLNDKTISSGLS